MMRSILAVALIAAGSAGGLLGQEPPQPPNTDQELFEGLDNDLFEGLDIPGPADEPSDPPKPGPASAANPGESEPREPHAETDQAASPLDEVRAQMRTASDLLRRRETAESSVVQQEVVEKLAALIDQLQQSQPQPQTFPSPESPQPGASQPMPEQTADSGSGEQAGQPAATENEDANESTPELRERELERVEVEDRSLLVKRAWGHLPEKVRERVGNARVDAFLPKYEKLIQRYFQTLARDQSGSP